MHHPIPFACAAVALACLLPPVATAQRPGRPGNDARGGAEVWAKLLQQYDADKDGRIERKEYTRKDEAFANLDKDGNGVLERADFVGAAQRSPRRPGQEKPAEVKLPKVGDVAPDFDLPMLGMKDTTVKLSSLRGKQPVALIFGSYT